jgi:hypothetical protein
MSNVSNVSVSANEEAARVAARVALIAALQAEEAAAVAAAAAAVAAAESTAANQAATEAANVASSAAAAATAAANAATAAANNVAALATAATDPRSPGGSSITPEEQALIDYAAAQEVERLANAEVARANEARANANLAAANANLAAANANLAAAEAAATAAAAVATAAILEARKDAANAAFLDARNATAVENVVTVRKSVFGLVESGLTLCQIELLKKERLNEILNNIENLRNYSRTSGVSTTYNNNGSLNQAGATYTENFPSAKFAKSVSMNTLLLNKKNYMFSNSLNKNVISGAVGFSNYRNDTPFIAGSSSGLTKVQQYANTARGRSPSGGVGRRYGVQFFNGRTLVSIPNIYNQTNQTNQANKAINLCTLGN